MAKTNYLYGNERTDFRRLFEAGSCAFNLFETPKGADSTPPKKTITEAVPEIFLLKAAMISNGCRPPLRYRR